MPPIATGPAPPRPSRPEPVPAPALAEPLPPACDPLAPLPIRSPFIVTEPHLRRLLDGMLLMTAPRAAWATLLRRSHGIDVLDCPRCHGRLEPVAVIRDVQQARRFLAHCGRPDRPPSLAPARDPTCDVA